VTHLPTQLDTTGAPNGHVALTGWLLPLGSWLVSNGTVGMLLVASGPAVEPRVLISAEPANGHHCVTACVASSFSALAA
jgi:hypothetical protein